MGLSRNIAAGGVLRSGTAVSASGTSVDFTGIPSWVKRITVMFSGVSLSGTSNYLIQLGDSGGIETTGYTSTGSFYNGSNQTSALSSTSGFVINVASTASIITAGQMVLTLVGSNTWISAHNTAISTTSVGNGAGNKALSDVLDRVRITTVNGTDTFDAGTINILYE